VGLKTGAKAVRGNSVSIGGYLTALTESHRQWASHDIRGYINVYTDSEIGRFKVSVR
jgi:hypothetical protein